VTAERRAIHAKEAGFRSTSDLMGDRRWTQEAKGREGVCENKES